MSKQKKHTEPDAEKEVREVTEEELEELDAEAPEQEENGEPESEPDPKDQKIAELDDRFKRLFAEFDNFRKRSETEKAGRFSDGEKTVLLKILPLIDNFERALANVPAELEGNAYVEGMEKIYRSFMDLMKELGVAPIEAVGQPFDANLHNAVMHVEDAEQPENTVVEEFQKGYLFGDKVLRYSMVKVAN